MSKARVVAIGVINRERIALRGDDDQLSVADVKSGWEPSLGVELVGAFDQHGDVTLRVAGTGELVEVYFEVLYTSAAEARRLLAE